MYYITTSTLSGSATAVTASGAFKPKENPDFTAWDSLPLSKPSKPAFPKGPCRYIVYA